MGHRKFYRFAAGPEIPALLAVLAGVCVTLGAAMLALHWTAGIGNYLHWTVEYAGQRRLPGFSLMLGVYRDPSCFGRCHASRLAWCSCGCPILRAP